MKGSVDPHDGKADQIHIEVVEVEDEDDDRRKDEFTDHDARATGAERELIVFIEKGAFRDLMAPATFAGIHQTLPEPFRIHGRNAYTYAR